ncbi:hypothetical protein TNCV_4507311 [Trichonephila clavipes]|nr:hypothetical protein TNCV_4507311 [Trichonephila clavipes]
MTEVVAQHAILHKTMCARDLSQSYGVMSVRIQPYCWLPKIERPWVAQWLEHRTPDRKAWVRCTMPPNTLRVHSEYVLVKSVGPKSCGLSQERRDWRIFPSPSVHAEIVEVHLSFLRGISSS